MKLRKKRLTSVPIWCYLALFLYSPLFADGLPDGAFMDNAGEPPPQAPIDNYLIWLTILSLVFAAYFFYKKNQSLKLRLSSKDLSLHTKKKVLESLIR